MITVKTKTQLFNMSGKPLENEENKPVLLGIVVSNILGGKVSNPTLGWILGKKFATEDEVDLKAEEVVFLKEEILKVATNPSGWLSAVIAGQIIEMFEKKPDSIPSPIQKN